MARRRKKEKKIIAPHAFQPKQLESFLTRIVAVRARAKKAAAEAAEDINIVIREAEKAGFHGKLVRKAAAEKFKLEANRMTPDERECLNDYRSACGLPVDTPLGKWADKNMIGHNSNKSDGEADAGKGGT